LQIKRYEKLETIEDRRKLAREIYDNFIMKELLSHTHVMIILLLLDCLVSHVIRPLFFSLSVVSVLAHTQRDGTSSGFFHQFELIGLILLSLLPLP
jgi:hypothetical protein